MKKLKKGLLCSLLVLSMSLTSGCFGLSPQDGNKILPDSTGDVTASVDTPSTTATENTPQIEVSHRTKLKGNGEDTVTVMVYVCATDLESGQASATDDIIEMVSANISDKVNVILETGGTTGWQNDFISNETNQRFKVETEDLVCIDDNVGVKDMTEPETLSDFISFCSTNYPADRYMLILWDHGAGPIGGFASDEVFPDSPSMSIAEIDSVLSNTGIYFDFIGFDACLMGSFEVAYMLRKHADYYIASEELEPGYGWYYTNWLTDLSENTSIPTTELGKTIVDDMVAKNYELDQNCEATLSILDLLEIENVHNKLSEFSNELAALLEAGEYKKIATARNNTKAYAASLGYDMVDLVHFAQNMDSATSGDLISAVNNCVKYTLCSADISNSNGISLYFPYEEPEYFQQSLDLYDNIGMKTEVTGFFKKFVNYLVGGQGAIPNNDMFDTGENWNPDEYEEDYSEWEDYDWFDLDYINENAENYEEDYIDMSELAVFEKNDYWALTIPDDLWEKLNSIQIVAYVDDGEGYIELGYDNVYSFDEDYDLIVDFDMTWLAFNGQTVCYYVSEENENNSIGFVPAYLNDEYVYIYVVFDDSGARVLGAKRIYDDPLLAQKGYIPLKDGDVIQFTCDYYDYDENYDDEYIFGESFVVDGEIEVTYEDLSDNSFMFYYVLKDTYNNQFWSEAMVIE